MIGTLFSSERKTGASILNRSKPGNAIAFSGFFFLFGFIRRVELVGDALLASVLKSRGRSTKTKKPAAGGGAAGFSEITERQLGGGVLSFLQTALGGGVDRLIHEVRREEMPSFDG